MKRNVFFKAVLAAVVLSLMTAPCTYAYIEQPKDPSETGLTVAQLNGYTEEQWAAICDNHLDWGEIKERLRNFNSSLASGWNTYNDTLNNMKISEQILRDADKTSKDIVKSYEKMPVSPEQQAMLGFAKTSQMAVGMTKTQISQTVSAMNKDGSKYSRQLEKAEDQLTTAVQSLIIAYKTVEAQKAMLSAMSELYRESCDATAELVGQGMATAADLSSAQTNMLSAQSNMSSVTAAQEQLYRQILVLCGYNESDQVTFGDVPDSYISKIASYNPDADYETAVGNSTAVGQVLGEKHKHTDTGVGLWESNVDAAKRMLHTNLVSLYNDIIVAQQQYQAVQAGYESALQSKVLAEKQYELGLVTRPQYLGQTITFVQKQGELTSARLALIQAIISYDSALEGNCSVE